MAFEFLGEIHAAGPSAARASLASFKGVVGQVIRVSLHVGGGLSQVLLFAGFMLFSFMTNMGPNAMTYLIAGEVFPISIRGRGAGFAASFAKIGAVLTAFLFPILLKDIGTDFLLLILVGTSLLGALVTRRYAIETKGVNLEEIRDKKAGSARPRFPTSRRCSSTSSRWERRSIRATSGSSPSW